MMGSMLADGPATTAAQGAPTILFVAAALLVFVGVARLRERAFRRLSRPVAWGAVSLSGACVVAALVLPGILSPGPSGTRPSSTATIRIVEPRSGEVIHGNPATVTIRVGLAGGTITARTSTKLVPDEGHLHVFLDGLLVSMTYGLDQQVEVKPGTHLLQVVYVALDHAPFNPSVQASVRFRVVA